MTHIVKPLVCNHKTIKLYGCMHCYYKKRERTKAKESILAAAKLLAW